MPPNISGDFAKAWYARDEDARNAWARLGQGSLYEQGGEALLAHFRCS